MHGEPEAAQVLYCAAGGDELHLVAAASQVLGQGRLPRSVAHPDAVHPDGDTQDTIGH